MNRIFERYLGLLGVHRSTPSIEGLCQIVRAHMMRVPFENISKLYHMRRGGLKNIQTLDQFLDGVDRYNLGGTCYANGFHLHQLLRYLGYDVDLCGADMNKPDVHLLNIVRIEGREFVVDVGYAAPFLTPLPRDLTFEYIIPSGGDRYVLSPMDAKKRSRLTFYSNGIPRHWYQVNPRPRTIDEFSAVISDSYTPRAQFINAILLARFTDHCWQVLRNTVFSEFSGSLLRKRTLGSMDEIIDIIERSFSIPASISHVALDGLVMNDDVWNS